MYSYEKSCGNDGYDVYERTNSNMVENFSKGLKLAMRTAENDAKND